MVCLEVRLPEFSRLLPSFLNVSFLYLRFLLVFKQILVNRTFITSGIAETFTLSKFRSLESFRGLYSFPNVSHFLRFLRIVPSDLRHGLLIS